MYKVSVKTLLILNMLPVGQLSLLISEIRKKKLISEFGIKGHHCSKQR